MQRFIEAVQEPSLKEKLAAALVGKGAFRRFKDQLLAYPEIRQQWFAFKDNEVYTYARDWLEREGVYATNDFPTTPPDGHALSNMIPPVPLETPQKTPTHRRGPVSHVDLSSMPEDEIDWAKAIADYDRDGLVFRPERAALLVVDMQRVFVDPEGETYLPMSAGACERLKKMVEACRQESVPVFFTRHVHQQAQQDGGSMARWWSSLIMEGTPDAELVETLQPLETERVITKCRYSAFAGTPLEMILRSTGVEDLIIGGVMTNLCCETTARDAFVRDFNVFFLADGTATADEALHLSSLRNIAHGFGRVMGVAEAVKTLQGGD
jgi:isochorismate hydrolase